MAEFTITIKTHFLDNCGFRYPLTYKFLIPSGGYGYLAYHRHTIFEAWEQLPAYLSSQTFNGEEVVRWDYTNRICYVSVSFGHTNGDILIKLTDGVGASIDAEFLGIARYYDNRDAGVSPSWDDWKGSWAYGITWAEALATRGLYNDLLTVTGGMNWTGVATVLQMNYTTLIPHSITHRTNPGVFTDEQLFNEMCGCRNAIIANVSINDVPWQSVRDGTVFYPFYAWPGGDYRDSGTFTDRPLETGLLCTPPFIGHMTHSYGGSYIPGYCDSTPFGVCSRFESKFGDYGVCVFGRTVSLDQSSGSYSPGYCGLTEAKAKAHFDNIVALGGVYSSVYHPTAPIELWVTSVLDYISGDKSLWYASMTHMAMYFYMRRYCDIRCVRSDTSATPTTIAEAFASNVPTCSNIVRMGDTDATATIASGALTITNAGVNSGVVVKTPNAGYNYHKVVFDDLDADNPYASMGIGKGAIWGPGDIHDPDYRFSFFVHGYHIEIYSDKVLLIKDGDYRYEYGHTRTLLDTWADDTDADNEHTYEMTLDGSDVIVKRDDVEILRAVDETTYVSGYTFSAIGTHE